MTGQDDVGRTIGNGVVQAFGIVAVGAVALAFGGRLGGSTAFWGVVGTFVLLFAGDMTIQYLDQRDDG